jgi:hypothetical protein
MTNQAFFLTVFLISSTILLSFASACITIETSAEKVVCCVQSFEQGIKLSIPEKINESSLEVKIETTAEMCKIKLDNWENEKVFSDSGVVTYFFFDLTYGKHLLEVTCGNETAQKTFYVEKSKEQQEEKQHKALMTSAAGTKPLELWPGGYVAALLVVMYFIYRFYPKNKKSSKNQKSSFTSSQTHHAAEQKRTENSGPEAQFFPFSSQQEKELVHKNRQLEQ